MPRKLSEIQEVKVTWECFMRLTSPKYYGDGINLQWDKIRAALNLGGSGPLRLIPR